MESKRIASSLGFALSLLVVFAVYFNSSELSLTEESTSRVVLEEATPAQVVASAPHSSTPAPEAATPTQQASKVIVKANDVGKPMTPVAKVAPVAPPPVQKKAKAAPAGKIILVEDKLAVPILTPSLKTRKTRKVILPNKLRVYIVSDPELPQSAAGLANEDGSWNNPNDALGLAHFNEHMVFMGTKKNPKASAFDDFLEANGAQASNAATGGTITQFAFAVGHNAYSKAIDMFANMFTQPLFTPKGLHKEIHAVDQEYEMHKDDDGWRQNFIQKATYNPAHPGHRFSIGTLKTLGKVDHNEIQKFFKTHYSANLMTASMLTALPLDKAQELAEKTFGTIPNRNLKHPDVNVPLLDPKMVNKAVWQKSIKTTYSVSLNWELPEALSQKNPKNDYIRPDRLLSHVMNYVGEKSIFTALRNAKLAHSVSAGQQDRGRDNSMFTIDIQLTPDGFKHWKKAVHMVFESLAKLKKTGVPKHIFDTMQLTDKQGFQWQWRNGDVFDAAQSTAADMNGRTDFAAYPFLDNVIQKYDKKAVASLIDVLKPNAVYIYAMSPKFPVDAAKAPIKIEPYYKAKYKIFDLGKKTVGKWTAAKPAAFLEIPPVNNYLATDLKATTKLLKKPPVYPALPKAEVLAESPKEKAHLWVDNMFGDPYVSGSMTMKTSKNIIEKQGVDALIKTSLLMACINHAIVPKLHPFVEAGLTWSLGTSKGTNVALSFSGTNPDPKHYGALMNKVAGFMRTAGEGKLKELVDKDTFNMLKVSTLHALQNSLKSSPTSKAFQKLHYAMLNLAYPTEVQIKSCKKTTFDDVIKFGPQLFDQNFFTGFFAGQLDKAKAKKVWDATVKKLTLKKDAKPLPQSLMQTNRMRDLPQQPTFLQTSGISRGYTAVLLVDAGGLNCKEREALSVLYEAVPNRFYNDLRSKQQTGYLVQTSADVMVSHHNVINFVVQSSKYKPGDLLKRFNIFIAAMLKDLASKDSKTLPKKKFGMIRNSKLLAYKTPNQNIASMSSILTTLLENYNGDYTTMQKKKALAEQMKYEEVLAIAQKVFGAQNKKKLAVAYTTKGVKLDALPKEFKPFNMKMGKLVGKPHFKCPVNLKAPARAKAIGKPPVAPVVTKAKGKGGVPEAKGVGSPAAGAATGAAGGQKDSE
jgi:insulysin